MVIKKIRSVSEILDCTKLASEKIGEDLWWRGNSDTDFKLVPSAFRDPKATPSFESGRLVRFMTRGTPLLDAPLSPDDYSGWLSTARHHGLPTRLLDWSESPLVALWFATTGAFAKITGDASFYALNAYRLNEKQIELPHTLLGFSPKGQAYSALAFEAAHDPQIPIEEHEKVPREKIVGLVVNHIDPRMRAQDGSFTIHDTPIPIEELPDVEKFLVKFEVERNSIVSIHNELHLLGIRESMIYPDLDHLASELSKYKFTELAKN